KLRAVPMSPSMELSAVVPALAGGVARGLPSRWLRKENKDSRDFLCFNRLCTELAAKDLDVRQTAAESLAQLSKGDSFAVVMASHLQLVMCGLKPAQPGPVKLAILGALRSIAEKGHAVSVALHSNTLLPCLEDQDILVQRKVSALYRVLAEEGAAGMIAPDVKSIMQCFEATQANGVPLAAPLDALSAIAIAGEGLAVASVVDPLLRSLKDGRPKIRKSACATLGAIASGGAKELLGSLGLCADAQGRGRASLFEMLVCTALDDRDDDVRLEAADALRCLPEADPDTCDETRQRFPLLVKRLRAERYGRYGDSRRGAETKRLRTFDAHRLLASACALQVVCPSTMAAGGHKGYCKEYDKAPSLFGGNMLTSETYFCYASATAGQAPSELLLKSGGTTPGCPQAVQSHQVGYLDMEGEPGVLFILPEQRKRCFYKNLLWYTLSSPVISPEGFKLVEVVRETGESGVVEFDFPIAEEPLLGRHVARAVLEATVGAGASAEASFGIEEYVLPRFEVGVVLDQSHLTYGRANSGDVTVTGKVSANFTFGEPVPGVASLTLWAPLDPWEVSSRMGGAAMDGGASIDSTDSLSTTAPTPFELTIPSSQLRYGTLQAEASVVYAATGERQSSATSLPVLYEGSELQADISLSDGTKVFRPGLPMKVSVRLEKPGGQAVSAEDLKDLEVRLAQEANTESYSHRPDTVYYDLATSDWKDGLQACGCCVYGLNFHDSLNLQAINATPSTFEDTRRSIPHLPISVASRYMPMLLARYWQRIYTGVEGKSAYGCAGRAWSPDGSYLALSAPVEEGNAWRAQLTSSRPPAELQSDVEYLVTQAGTFVASGVAQPSFTASGSHYEASLQMTLPTS
ncbi:unnamed protein product, partial [Symbiodinium microadriaticum]